MRILIAEDDSVTRRVLSARLRRWCYEVTAVADGQAALELLTGNDPPRLALLDWEMPGMDGVDICGRVRESASGRYSYLILLTGRESQQDLVVGLRAGADDYLRKPFDEAELEARLRVGIRILTLQEELVQAREAMRHQATHDGLTGLANRASLMDSLKIEVAQLARRGGSLSVAMIDLDHFKRINDTLGHAAGDAVLVQTTQRVANSVRPYDRFGRVGGEEFVILLPGCDLQGAAAVAERVRAAIAAEPVILETGPIDVTASIGVATITDPAQAESLLPRADEAMYKAKHGGRNRVGLAT